MNPTTVTVDAIATARIARLITADRVPFGWIRKRIVKAWPPAGDMVTADDGWTFSPPDANDRVEAARWVRIFGVDHRAQVPAVVVEYAEGHPPPPVRAMVCDDGAHLGELVTCPWCSSMYVAFAVVVARQYFPRLWDPVARALAYSAAAGLLASVA